jgi:Nitroreductase
MRYEEFKELTTKARTYRRFKEGSPIAIETLTDIVDTARVVPSAGNGQPLRYAVSVNRDMNARIFANLKWAAALKEWPGPLEGERPAGYIVMGSNTAPKLHQIDLGIAAQTIQLGLAAQGITCCMLASINAKAIHQLVGFPEDIPVLLVLALGYPGEKVVLEPLPADGGTTYWRDEKDNHHVPKRALQDILLKTFA